MPRDVQLVHVLANVVRVVRWATALEGHRTYTRRPWKAIVRLRLSLLLFLLLLILPTAIVAVFEMVLNGVLLVVAEMSASVLIVQLETFRAGDRHLNWSSGGARQIDDDREASEQQKRANHNR